MKGGINKIIRSAVASSQGKSDFDKVKIIGLIDYLEIN